MSARFRTFDIAAGGVTAIAAAVMSVIVAGGIIIAGIAATGATVIGVTATGGTIALGAMVTMVVATTTIVRMHARMLPPPIAGRMRTASACAGGKPRGSDCDLKRKRQG